MNVLALIPARSGSQSIKDKNIRPLAGKPLLAWSVGHALAARTVTRTIVSTDSAAYAAIARQAGAEVPFLRPAEFSGARATDLEVFDHALRWLDAHEGYRPDLCVHLRPTHPVRDPADIDKMVDLLARHPDLDSVRSVVGAPETPFKMWFRADDGLLSPVIQTSIREAHSLPRQALPSTYLQNASVDVVRTSVLLNHRSMTGRNIHGYVMDDNYDIDDEAQWEHAQQRLEQLTAVISAGPTPRTFVFDIDGVVATLVSHLEYDQARPNMDMIRAINFLYSQGHRIILFTARGALTGKDWRELTLRQMAEWGVRYHDIGFDKPAADYYVDDKSLPVTAVIGLARQWGMPEPA